MRLSRPRIRGFERVSGRVTKSMALPREPARRRSWVDTGNGGRRYRVVRAMEPAIMPKATQHHCPCLLSPAGTCDTVDAVRCRVRGEDEPRFDLVRANLPDIADEAVNPRRLPIRESLRPFAGGGPGRHPHRTHAKAQT